MDKPPISWPGRMYTQKRYNTLTDTNQFLTVYVQNIQKLLIFSVWPWSYLKVKKSL